MGAIRSPQPVLFIVAAFAARDADLAWASAQLTARCGNIAFESESFCVDDYTTYYAATMGTQLTKQLWGFETLIDAASLPSLKILTNAIEDERATKLASNGEAVSPRPVNLDAGYVDLGKLVLASTKDHAHRIYLRDGIFAETTLAFTRSVWTPFPWTYPDYRETRCHEFLNTCRAHLKKMRDAISQHNTTGK